LVIVKKRCPKCKRILFNSEFHKCKSRKDGLDSWCKKCVYKSRKERRIFLKKEVMIFFGSQCAYMKNGIQCSKNVVDDLDKLELCHPNGDGNEHRNLISNGQTGYLFYKALKDRNWNTDGYVIEVRCKSHHRSLDFSGKKSYNYGKYGRLHPRYKKGRFNDPIWLKERYVDDKMTSREIADLCGVSRRTISRRIVKFGIQK